MADAAESRPPGHEGSGAWAAFGTGDGDGEVLLSTPECAIGRWRNIVLTCWHTGITSEGLRASMLANQRARDKYPYVVCLVMNERFSALPDGSVLAEAKRAVTEVQAVTATYVVMPTREGVWAKASLRVLNGLAALAPWKMEVVDSDASGCRHALTAAGGPDDDLPSLMRLCEKLRG